MAGAGSGRGASRRAQRRESRGAAALEFAPVLSVLVMILIGTVTTGASYSRALSVSNAVREGARYGATADGSAASWLTDVQSRVRTTQFDPNGSTTSICVQLYKHGTGSVKVGCDLASGPALTMPAITSYPAEPSGVLTGQCIVRVVAARKFTINLVVFGSITRTMTRGAVARYEGTC
ncbi:MAG: TadE/TadG family type IV pilus assembly protein [Nocardioidaceae bacterium]